MVRSSAVVLAVLLPTLLSQPTQASQATWEEKLQSWDKHQQMTSESPFQGLPWRSVGPVIQGGRLVDIEVVPGEPYSFYVAYASGGLWKTANNGVTLEPLFDNQPTMIISDVAIDPSNPGVIWVGTGENNSSRSSYGGLGLLRSEDGGATWDHAGLGDSDRIGRIWIDPRDGQRVLVAALGPLYTPGGQRGVYRTTDNGGSWEQVLEGDANTGFVDLVADPSDPDVLYAAAWQRSRRPWEFQEGGEGSAIWKTTDGGESWDRLAGGFPKGEPVGRIGLAVFPGDSQILYASVDHQEQLPESQWDLGDGAVTAKRLRHMTKEDFLRQDKDEVERFLRSNDLDPELDAEALIAQVQNDEVTVQDLVDALSNANEALFETDIRGIEVWRSDDGGSSWRRTHEEPLRQVVYTYGYYFGQIRVSPADPDRVYVLGVPLVTSDDGGATWSSIDARNMHGDHQAMWINPAHPDHIVAGNDGGLNMTFDGGSSWLRLNAQEVGQFYAITVDMKEPYNVYGGLQDNGVLKGSSRWRKGVSPTWSRVGGGDGMYVQIDPDDQSVYWGYQFGNYFRNNPDGSRDPIKPRNKLKEEALRYNWQTPIQLSPHNPDIVYFGANKLFRSLDRGTTWEAISPDLTRSEERGNVPFATLTTLSESPLRFGQIWAGTDDGRVWVTRDGGVTWKDLTASFPPDRWVTRVEASHHDEYTAHVSLSGYRDDDIATYVFRTEDLGETFQDIAQGLPAEAANVIREDPVNPDVLYLGTDGGAYVSLDRGASWESLSGGLPHVPVHDLVIHPRDRELVAGTHGRSIWILDVLPIQELEPEVRDQPVYVFPKESIQAQRHWKSRRNPWFFREAEAESVELPYWVRDGGPVEISLVDDEGRVLLKKAVETSPGVNVFTWNLLLDEELATAAERQHLNGRDKGKKRGKDEEMDVPMADKPWQEAIRLGRPLYVTPGDYLFKVSAGDQSQDTEIKVEAPEPLTPRTPKKPKIRAQKDD